VPPNGLVIYCGTIVTEENKEKKVNIDFEPFKPINTSLYLCDNKFHTEALTALLADDNKFGFIIMDGNGALFGTLQVSLNCAIVVGWRLIRFFSIHREILAKCCTNLTLNFPRSTVEVVNLLFVSPVFEWKNVTTTSERLLK
jgi:hypothetical protein